MLNNLSSFVLRKHDKYEFLLSLCNKMIKKEECEEEEVIYDNPEKYFDKLQKTWYSKSTEFWSKQDPTDDGMLGKFPKISGVDIYDSRDIIEKYQKKGMLGKKRAADCGSGVGRVTNFCLSDYFETCDLIDPVDEFLKKAVESLGSYKVRTFNMGIQDWKPDEKYDCIWCQWSVMYLTDNDAIDFFKRCKSSITSKGLIFVKDNISSTDLKAGKDTCMIDMEDHGLSRAYQHYLELFEKAGLQLIEAQKQSNYPGYLLPLYTFVLK